MMWTRHYEHAKKYPYWYGRITNIDPMIGYRHQRSKLLSISTSKFQQLLLSTYGWSLWTKMCDHLLSTHLDPLGVNRVVTKVLQVFVGQLLWVHFPVALQIQQDKLVDDSAADNAASLLANETGCSDGWWWLLKLVDHGWFSNWLMSVDWLMVVEAGRWRFSMANDGR